MPNPDRSEALVACPESVNLVVVVPGPTMPCRATVFGQGEFDRARARPGRIPQTPVQVIRSQRPRTRDARWACGHDSPVLVERAKRREFAPVVWRVLERRRRSD